jgi:hypothetical protein
MVFSPGGDLLLCISVDATGYLLPAKLLMRNMDFSIDKEEKKSESAEIKKQSSLVEIAMNKSFNKFIEPGKKFLDQIMPDSKFFDQILIGSDNQEIPKQPDSDSALSMQEFRITSKPLQMSISDCVWWRASASEDYAIIATLSGKLVFVNLNSHARCSCSLKVAISKLQLIEERFLLVQTLDGTYFRIGLTPESVSKGSLIPEPLRKFSVDTRLSAFPVGSTVLVGAHIREVNKIELYEASLEGIPMLDFFIRKLS